MTIVGVVLWKFIIIAGFGLIIGGCLGLLAGSICAAGGRAGEEIERLLGRGKGGEL